MKLTGYTKTWRPAMSAETLVRLFGRWPDRDESIPALAGALEDFEPDELARPRRGRQQDRRKPR